jgi:predicted dehydrogenase
MLGVGFVGAGAVVQAIHLPALASLASRFRVRHVVDASAAVASSVADRLGARHGTDVGALLDDPDVDVVVVATPDASHPRIAIDACRARKRAVLVEKPLAMTLGEAEAIVTASRGSGVPIQVGTMHVHDPAFQAAQPFIRDAHAVTVETLIGPNDAAIVDAVELVTGTPDVVDAVATMMSIGAPLVVAGADAGQEWALATRLLLGLSTHDLAILRAAHGEPSTVLDARVLGGAGLQVVLGYDSGLIATLLAYPTETKFHSWRARWLSPQRVVDVAFPVSFSSSAASTLEVHEREDRFARTRRWSGRDETGFRLEWLHLHAVAHGDAEPIPSVDDAAADVALVERIVRAGTGTSRGTDSEGSRIALTAAGWIAAVHAPIVNGLGHRVSAVASRTERSAERISWPHHARASTIEDLDLADVDVVIVAGPPATHAGQALRALDAGAIVLVEKPLTTTLADADRLVAGERPVGYLENWAFAPVVRGSIDAVRRGDVGRVERVDVRCLHSSPAWGHHLEPAWGGGCLYDLGPHPVWWALALLGAPVARVRATLSADDTRADVELHAAGGLVATVAVSWQQPTPRDIHVDAVVTGDRAALRATLEPRAELSLDPGGSLAHLEPGRALIVGAYRKAGYIQQLARFLGDDWTELPTGADGRDVLEVICAAYLSDGRHGAWIDLPFTGPRDLSPYELRRLPPSSAASDLVI